MKCREGGGWPGPTWHVASSLGLVFASYILDWVLEKPVTQTFQREPTKKPRWKPSLWPKDNERDNPTGQKICTILPCSSQTPQEKTQALPHQQRLSAGLYIHLGVRSPPINHSPSRVASEKMKWEPGLPHLPGGNALIPDRIREASNPRIPDLHPTQAVTRPPDPLGCWQRRLSRKLNCHHYTAISRSLTKPPPRHQCQWRHVGSSNKAWVSYSGDV